MALNFYNSAFPAQRQVKLTSGSNKCHQNVKNLVSRVGVPSISCSPDESLQKGNWVKLICGASFEDVVDIRNLSLVYTLAGVDCIDCAADASVVSAVNEGIEAAREIVPLRRPWVMVSVNDDEDLHFRKAEFDPENCPLDCPRPCENVCPASAILFEKEKSIAEVFYRANQTGEQKSGVITERCYGCGRCFPVCPYDKIGMVTYVRDTAATAELLRRDDVDAVEIHTSARQIKPFRELWDGLDDSITYLRLVAVSLPNIGDETVSSMNSMYSVMQPCLSCFNLWQLDGRPMSGDIGQGATRQSIEFAVHLASAKYRPPGFLQLAGGTNAHTVDGLKRKGLFQTSGEPKQKHSIIGGIAYGGYARKIIGRILSSLQPQHGFACIEDYPDHLLEALGEAIALVGTVYMERVEMSFMGSNTSLTRGEQF
ncbi:hypothetical protein SLEP1_g52152 [Rubroshorea leprosula]|uniref:4Fe-4S ferredoxin-type domain-containing protein n=1 Tax=Rubroshorea leprosula TaxID=152421 RepID=A0AAV5M5D4_9ROSI|nr:hypothetical protein SLEP1_g52152 [Rubroshorea leprosula]